MQHAATRSLPLAAHPFRPAALSASPRHVTIGRAALTGGPGRTTSNPRRKAVLPRAKKPKEQPDAFSSGLSPSDVDVIVQFYKSVVERQAGGGDHASGGGVADWAAVPVEHAAPNPCPGRQPEELSPVEPLEAAAQAAKEVLNTAAQLGDDAASDAADVAGAVQQLADDAVSDAVDAAGGVQLAAADVQQQAVEAAAGAASDAADVTDAVQQLADDAFSDAVDAAGGVQLAAADVQQQAVEAAADAASDAADVADAVQQAANDVQQQVAEAVAETAQTLADAAGAVADTSAPSSTSRSAILLQAPAPPAGSLQAPQQPVASMPPPAPSSSSRSNSAVHASGSAAADRADEIEALKRQLLSLLASLDRGAAASEAQAQRVDNLTHRLEVLGGAVTLSWEKPASGAKPTMALLEGRWRLLYSSGFNSGSLGGRRPGPSLGSLPLTLGQVYQDIYTDRSELDNVVDLLLRWSIASLPGISAGVPSAHARLRHTFQIIGAATIEITFEDTEVKVAGGLQGWLDSLPTFSVPKLPAFLQTPKGLRSACFDVVFLDEQMRITRGDRGELRVFVKGEA